MVALYKPSENDPLAAEHQLLNELIDAALKKHRGAYFYDIDLKVFPQGQELLAGDVEQARRYVMAAIAQAEYWDRRLDEVHAQAKTPIELSNPHMLPGWSHVWTNWRFIADVVKSLMRRSLPFDKADLIAVVEWCCRCRHLSSSNVLLAAIVRGLERYAGKQPFDEEMLQACAKFAGILRGSYDKEIVRLGTKVVQLRGMSVVEDDADNEVTFPPPEPGIAGSQFVFMKLKEELGMLTSDSPRQTLTEGPDEFEMPKDSPLIQEHRLLSQLFEEVIDAEVYLGFSFADHPAGRRVLELSYPASTKLLLAACERRLSGLITVSTEYRAIVARQGRYAANIAATSLLQVGCQLDRDQLFDLILYFATGAPREALIKTEMLDFLISEAERQVKEKPITEGERFVLHLFRSQMVFGPALGLPSNEVQRLTKMILDGANFYLVPREVWTDALNADVSQSPAVLRVAWSNLLKHCVTATAARPSGKWLKVAIDLIEKLGAHNFRKGVEEWLPLVSRGRTMVSMGRYAGDFREMSDTIHDENANILRGLLWCVPLLPQHDSLPRLVAGVALSAYKKVPGVGPRAVKVGNGAVYALSALGTKEAVGQLAMLKVRVRFGTAQKEIEKAFDAAATALSLPRDQIEELGVPSYGMEEVGLLVEQLGDYRAELRVNGSDAALQWFDAKGKSLKSVPAKVKNEHKEELKELQQSLKDVQAMLPAQRDRIDSLFLLQKSWPVTEWRERYLEHPLVGTIARRLIWCVDGISAVYLDGNLTDGGGKIVNCGEAAEITLWHPAGRTADEITDWRQRLEELKIVQPFKQAYREIYLLTDAERNTRTYSNRFAAHVIKQHQFNALCAARGWKNKLRLMVDDSYPPASKELPEWGLRAEFWIEGIGDDYGTDTNDAGTYLRLSTDQVRFYQLHAAINYAHAGGGGYESVAGGPGDGNINAPLPLEQVPALVLSEIMRDVDLFVGVASVGNDPTWQDGGPEGRYRTYWQSYSFGELSGTATTRKQVLERLIPRLKIASQCSFSDRFLIVRGKRRTYKIHLGSGNILMEPNDQYLCIVPDSRARKGDDEVYLPFEGDSTLSIIISKALLLADDLKISDSTITRQIDMK